MSLSNPIRTLLVANRGEIAQRIIQTARELDIKTYALYTPEDTTHAAHAHHALPLPKPESYLDSEHIINLCLENGIDAVHPGYGFLSESAAFAAQAEAKGVRVIGPGADILTRTGDKLAARRLAEENAVPVLPALATPTRDVSTVRAFAERAGYPVMIKAVDGGGGRGIRLVSREEELEAAVRRAVEESPSRLVFAEGAAVGDGWLHVEVQVVGDGTDAVHLLERQCSVQRRFQKVVEVAPCVRADRGLVGRVVDCAVRMAKSINYLSLGTFEFLANPTTNLFYFLEINPRLQVEHTLTETLLATDLVRTQLLIAQGASLFEAALPSPLPSATTPTARYACQLRVTAEDVARNWALSVGKVSEVRLPGGNGVRVDAALVPGQVVGAAFDSLLAKIIVSGPTWASVVRKARRALEDAVIGGVVTNLDVLRGIVASPEFEAGDCDTTWLERNQTRLLELGRRVERPLAVAFPKAPSADMTASSSASSAALFRKGDAWTVDLKPTDSKPSEAHHLALTRILRNDFPTSLSADVQFTSPNTPPRAYTLKLTSTTASAAAVTSAHRRGNPSDPTHIIIPFSGTLIEVVVDEGDVVRTDDVVCVVRQMKMEIEIRARRAGRVEWVTEVEDGEEVVEGVLAAVVVPVGGARL